MLRQFFLIYLVLIVSLVFLVIMISPKVNAGGYNPHNLGKKVPNTAPVQIKQIETRAQALQIPLSVHNSPFLGSSSSVLFSDDSLMLDSLPLNIQQRSAIQRWEILLPANGFSKEEYEQNWECFCKMTWLIELLEKPNTEFESLNDQDKTTGWFYVIKFAEPSVFAWLIQLAQREQKEVNPGVYMFVGWLDEAMHRLLSYTKNKKPSFHWRAAANHHLQGSKPAITIKAQTLAARIVKDHISSPTKIDSSDENEEIDVEHIPLFPHQQPDCDKAEPFKRRSTSPDDDMFNWLKLM